MFQDTSQHPFTAELESNHTAIRAEFEQLAPGDFMDWPEKGLYEKGWTVFGLCAYGQRMEKNCSLCPVTMRIAESIPGLTTIGFSVLQPQTVIAPHSGYTDRIYRCHLGLLVPENCAIRVGTETREWQEGKTMIFQDHVEHSAWNRSDSVRVVLLLDFLKNPDSEADMAAVMALGKEFSRIHNVTF